MRDSDLRLNGFTLERGMVVLYTAATCNECSNTATAHNNAGLGVFVGSHGVAATHNLRERLPGSKQTCERAELMAVIRAIELFPHHPLLIKFSSNKRFARISENSAVWKEAWYRSHQVANGRPVLNEDLIKRLFALIDSRRPWHSVAFANLSGDVFYPQRTRAIALADLGAKESARAESLGLE